jgi:hypothetical protein
MLAAYGILATYTAREEVVKTTFFVTISAEIAQISQRKLHSSSRPEFPGASM